VVAHTLTTMHGQDPKFALTWIHMRTSTVYYYCGPAAAFKISLQFVAFKTAPHHQTTTKYKYKYKIYL
jgi:hypothetical protein